MKVLLLLVGALKAFSASLSLLIIEKELLQKLLHNPAI